MVTTPRLDTTRNHGEGRLPCHGGRTLSPPPCGWGERWRSSGDRDRVEIAHGEGGGSRCAASPFHVLVATSSGHRRTGSSEAREALAGGLPYRAWRPVSLRRRCRLVGDRHAAAGKQARYSLVHPGGCCSLRVRVRCEGWTNPDGQTDILDPATNTAQKMLLTHTLEIQRKKARGDAC